MDLEDIRSFPYSLLLGLCFSDSLLQMKLNLEKNAVEMYHFRMNQLGNPHEYFIKNYYSFQNKNNINYQISFLYLLKYFSQAKLSNRILDL